MGRMDVSHFDCLGADKLWVQERKKEQNSSALDEFKVSCTPALLAIAM